MTQHARLREAAHAATPGPWRVMVAAQFGKQDWLEVGVGPYTWSSRHQLGIPDKPEDAAFIALADPTTVLALLDTIERYKDALEDIAGSYHCETEGCLCIGGDTEKCVGGTAAAALLTPPQAGQRAGDAAEEGRA